MRTRALRGTDGEYKQKEDSTGLVAVARQVSIRTLRTLSPRRNASISIEPNDGKERKSI
jgi:hypothetical protein